MCRVSQCCCGCSLQTGCKILAILGLIFGGIGLFRCVVDIDAEASTILEIVSHAFYILASAMLLYGTLKRQTTPILAYLVVQALCMLIMAILIILLLIGMVVAIPTAADEIAADDDDLTKEDAAKIATVILVVFTAIYALALLLSIYFWSVVYSFFKELKEGGAGNSQVKVMGAKA